MRRVKRAVALGICLAVPLWGACAEFAARTQTYTVTATAEQVADVRRILHLPECPPLTSAAALAVQATTGGAVVTVRCQ